MNNNTFTLTQDHLTLLQNMVVEWTDEETGAPGIHPKSPYGDSNVATSIADLLGWKQDGSDEYRYSEDQLEKAISIHRETEMALQVVLSTGQFEPGTYRKEGIGNNWEAMNLEEQLQKEAQDEEPETTTTEIAEDPTEAEDQGLQPQGSTVNVGPKNPLPEGKDNPVRITTADGETYDGYNLNGGFQTLDGLWVLADEGMDEIETFQTLA